MPLFFIISCLRKFVLPFKTKAYFEDYLRTVRQIVLEGNQRERWKIYLVFAGWTYFDLHNFYLVWKFRGKSDEDAKFQRALHGDLIYFIFQSEDFYPIFTTVPLVAVFNFTHNYLLQKPLLIALYENVFLRKLQAGPLHHKNFRLWHRYRPIDRRYGVRRYGQFEVDTLIVKVGVAVVNVLQVFPVVVGKKCKKIYIIFDDKLKILFLFIRGHLAALSCAGHPSAENPF